MGLQRIRGLPTAVYGTQSAVQIGYGTAEGQPLRRCLVRRTNGGKGHRIQGGMDRIAAGKQQPLRPRLAAILGLGQGDHRLGQRQLHVVTIGGIRQAVGAKIQSIRCPQDAALGIVHRHRHIGSATGQGGQQQHHRPYNTQSFHPFPSFSSAATYVASSSGSAVSGWSLILAPRGLSRRGRASSAWETEISSRLHRSALSVMPAS